MAERLDRFLANKAKKGFQGHPLATIAFYGPDRETATKVAVAVFTRDNSEADQLKRWHSLEGDVRHDEAIGQEIIHFLESAGVRSVAMSDGVIGCPHEEGPDYPEGQSCPQCPYWAGRDRWTDERVH
jgi:hypothetical protein